MWQLDHKEGWVSKNWCFWTMVSEKTLESPLDCKEIEPVNPRRNQSWIFIGRTDAKAEAPILWPPDMKNWLIRKDSDVGKDWRREEKGMAEDEMVGWHHWLWASWVWANSRSWWWTGKPGVLQSVGMQRDKHDWMTELTDWFFLTFVAPKLMALGQFKFVLSDPTVCWLFLTLDSRLKRGKLLMPDWWCGGLCVDQARGGRPSRGMSR